MDLTLPQVNQKDYTPIKFRSRIEKNIIFRRVMLEIIKRNNLATPKQLAILEAIDADDRRLYPDIRI